MAVIDITSEVDFNSRIGKAGLAVVDFYATWCGPCKAIAPQIEVLSTKYPTVLFLKVDVDKHNGLSSKYGVTAMPTFVILSKGSQLGTVKGANASEIERLIKANITKANSTGSGSGSSYFPGKGNRLGSTKSTTSGNLPTFKINNKVFGNIPDFAREPTFILLAIIFVFSFYLYLNKNNPSHLVVAR